MWVIAEYEATSLFTLKPASATSSGGRTLLVPTPFAIKMAILDVAIRSEGVDIADEMMEWLSSVQVAIEPPTHVVVNNTFMRVLRPRRRAASEGSADAGPFQRTIAYREYAQLDNFKIAVDVPDTEVNEMRHYLTYINYLGKRGSFMQIQRIPKQQDDLPDSFIKIGEAINGFDMDSVMTQLDDTAEDVTFTQVNIYSSGRGSTLRLGKHRILRHVALPYRLVRSSRGYSYYELSR